MRARGVPIAEIKKRGRWLTDQSLRRYEKATAAQALFNKLPTKVVTFGTAVKESLPDLVPLLASFVYHSKADPAEAQHLARLIKNLLPPVPQLPCLGLKAVPKQKPLAKGAGKTMPWPLM